MCMRLHLNGHSCDLFGALSRALVTQMFDTQDWTTVADKREDRQEYSDILDEDTGFSEVAKINT